MKSQERAYSTAKSTGWARRVSARRLAALDGEAFEREFLRLWTRYEAELKRRGTGISAADQPTDDQLQGADRSAATTSIVELDVAPEAAATLVLGWRASELRRWDWTRGS